VVEAVVELMMIRRRAEPEDMADPGWLDRPLPDELEAALHSSGRGGWSIIYPVEFSIVDAATMEYLPPLMNGLAEDIERQQLTLGSVRYTITDSNLGSLGAIRLRKVSNEQTEVTIEPPPKPGRRPPTEEERAVAQAQPDKTAFYQALRENDKRRQSEQAAHWRWRQATQAAIIRFFLERFDEEQEWLEKAEKKTQPSVSPAEAHRLPWRYPEDRWLWEQVNIESRRLKTVFQEWQQRAQDRDLDNFYETAKKIVQKGRKRGV